MYSHIIANGWSSSYDECDGCSKESSELVEFENVDVNVNMENSGDKRSGDFIILLDLVLMTLSFWTRCTSVVVWISVILISWLLRGVLESFHGRINIFWNVANRFVRRSSLIQRRECNGTVELYLQFACSELMVHLSHDLVMALSIFRLWICHSFCYEILRITSCLPERIRGIRTGECTEVWIRLRNQRT